MKKSFKVILASALTAVMLAAYSVGAFAAAPDGATHFDFDGSLGSATTTAQTADAAGGNITFSDGKYGQAAVFDGASGVKLGENLIDSNSYTIAFWVKADALTMHTPTFFGEHDANHWISVVPFGWNEFFGVWAGDDPWYDAFDTSALATGEWTHVALTVDNGTMKLYRNGSEVFTGEGYPDRFSAGNNRFYLGTNFWDTPFAGSIDDLYIYNNKVLTSSEIGDVMNAAPDSAVSEEAAELAETTSAEETSVEIKSNPTSGDYSASAAIPAIVAVFGAYAIIASLKKERA